MRKVWTQIKEEKIRDRKSLWRHIEGKAEAQTVSGGTEKSVNGKERDRKRMSMFCVYGMKNSGDRKRE